MKIGASFFKLGGDLLLLGDDARNVRVSVQFCVGFEFFGFGLSMDFLNFAGNFYSVEFRSISLKKRKNRSYLHFGRNSVKLDEIMVDRIFGNVVPKKLKFIKNL